MKKIQIFAIGIQQQSLLVNVLQQHYVHNSLHHIQQMINVEMD